MPILADNDGPQELKSPWLAFIRYPGRWLIGLVAFPVVAGCLVVGFRSWSVGGAIARIETNGGRVTTFYFEPWGPRRKFFGLLGWGDWYSVEIVKRPFGDAEFQRLVPDLQRLGTLVRLRLDGANISDTSIAAIASLNMITDLELQNTHVSDNGLRSLTQLENLSSICPAPTSPNQPSPN